MFIQLFYKRQQVNKTNRIKNQTKKPARKMDVKNKRTFWRIYKIDIPKVIV